MSNYAINSETGLMKSILLDIEGTTTPIDFVLETLFPFSKQRVGKYITTHIGSLTTEINQLVDESSGDSTYTNPVDPTEPGSVSSYLEYLIDENRKSRPLKSIQGRIWQEGYESGELVSPVFDDVPKAFKKWSAEGKLLGIFSSGSVLAQQLLFRYTDHGDLTGYISNYFDTNVGPKRDPQSYRTIATEIGTNARDILFASDIVEELDAARNAGLMTALTVRPGNASIEEGGHHRIVTTFDDLE